MAGYGAAFLDEVLTPPLVTPAISSFDFFPIPRISYIA